MRNNIKKIILRYKNKLANIKYMKPYKNLVHNMKKKKEIEERNRNLIKYGKAIFTRRPRINRLINRNDQSIKKKTVARYFYSLYFYPPTPPTTPPLASYFFLSLLSVV